MHTPTHTYTHTHPQTHTHTVTHTRARADTHCHTSTYSNIYIHKHKRAHTLVGRGGTLESRSLMVVGSNPALSTTQDLGEFFKLQLPVALRRVNSDTVSIAVVGRASERLTL